MTFTLGPTVVRAIVLRTLWPSVLVLMLTFLAIAYTQNIGWLTVGGVAITATGTRLWAARLMRLKPHAADDPLPPTSFLEPGAKGARLNVECFNEAGRRAADNFRSYVGVLLSIFGTIIALVPTIVDLVRDAIKAHT